jgi:hypothetical protein
VLGISPEMILQKIQSVMGFLRNNLASSIFNGKEQKIYPQISRITQI